MPKLIGRKLGMSGCHETQSISTNKYINIIYIHYTLGFLISFLEYIMSHNLLYNIENEMLNYCVINKKSSYLCKCQQFRQCVKDCSPYYLQK